MDSKLKETVIVIAVLAVLTIVGITFVINGFGKEKHTESVPAASSTESISKPLEKGKSYYDLHAWEHDDTFFDSEADSLAQRLMEQMSTLSIRAVSVEKDLRVSVLDYTNSLKTGEEFEIIFSYPNTTRKITKKDTDKDGVVYFDNVLPGEVLVYLNPYEGYIVPDAGVNVSVKEKAESRYIEDIELVANYADEEQREKEDLMELTALEEADKKQDNFYSSKDDVYGVDVSEENGEIDWKKVYESGISFAMIRAGYRGAEDGALYVDSRFEENVKNALKYGIDVGAYFFSQAINEKEAAEEASLLVFLSKDKNITYPLCIRFDRAGGTSRADELDTASRTDIADFFCKTVKNAEYEPCVYASEKWFGTNLEKEKLEKYTLWLGEYRSEPTFDGYFDLWQYSSKGKVNGIEGDVCLSKSFFK